ncbi:MAG: histidinol-phosphate transaminase [Prevotella sp.]|nr:histidinol-phosphate transaminase [Prevotella sp.]MBR4522584.1 histidinol-phosphate transaminase [Prevotella sp.]
MRTIKELVRPNIWSLAPYSSARNEYSGHVAHVFLDANENPFNGPYNRYPDPLQENLKEKLSEVKNVPAENIFLGNGSDEAIDLVYRCFCEPKKDNVVAICPTYGMYEVCANINDVEYRNVMLDEDYQITAEKLLAACDANTKAIWICSPNNPSGNNINNDEIEKVIENFDGIVVVDEAYIDFSKQKTFSRYINSETSNVIVLQTMSKAWGSAAIRLGMAFAKKEIIGIFNKVKYPYNVNMLTQEQAMKRLKDTQPVEQWINILLQERGRTMEAFGELPICEKIYPTDANFFLAKVKDAQKAYDYLVDKGIIVRNRTRISLCNNCLRITIGTREENNELIGALRDMK